MTLTDATGRRVEVRTTPTLEGVRLTLTIYPRKAFAGRVEIASAHLTLDLKPADCRQLTAGLSAYLLDEQPAAAGERSEP